MKVPQPLKAPLLKLIDSAAALIPRTRPHEEKLRSCRLISHRGERDGVKVKENTLQAFEQAIRVGAWGIEFDVRWTKDDQPIVFHDADAERVFKLPYRISDLTLKEVEEKLPEVPSLERLLERIPVSTHLMIELKDDGRDWTKHRESVLAAALRSRAPLEDYHLISLKPEILRRLEFLPRKACLPVAEINVNKLSEIALKEGFGGITGQYLVLADDVIERHHQAGQRVGTGFASSRSVLYREIHRGLDWIFTNHAGKLRSYLDESSTERAN